jgi:trimeric autotransporter adhesin
MRRGTGSDQSVGTRLVFAAATLLCLLVASIAVAGASAAGDPTARTSASVKKQVKKLKKKFNQLQEQLAELSRQPGPQGPPGEQGPPGPSTGAAGGDLTGNYPDPSIASGAVNSAKVLNGSLIGADIDEGSLDSSVLQRRVSDSCPAGESIRAIDATGASVTCETVGGGGNPTGPAGGDLAGSYPDPDIADAAVTIPKLAFDPATQAELDTHKGSGDHDSRYFTETELSTSDGNAPNAGANRVHWDVLNGVPAGFADGTDDTGNDWALAGNSGTTGSNFLGTTDNNPLNLRVNNARGLRLEPASDGTNQSPNVIGGIADNSVTAGVHSATISGGGRATAADPTTANRVTDNQGTVGGGTNNQAGDADATLTDATRATVGGGTDNIASGSNTTVGGGLSNTASSVSATVGGGNSNDATGSDATVAGGNGNTATAIRATVGGGASNDAITQEATVGGGASNTASGQDATVGGGGNNTAGGQQATVPGGVLNSAAGTNSFAAGRRAKANHNGAFVWADDQAVDIASTASNQFIARASGEFFLQSDSSLDDQGGFLNTSTGGFLSTGGAWTNASDKNLKQGFEAIEPRNVLAKVADLPVRAWSYKAEPDARHIGPTAQDFHAAFGLGGDNKHIASIDADGVALAAIKGLEAENERLSSTLRTERHLRLKQEREFEERLSALERDGR